MTRISTLAVVAAVLAGTVVWEAALMVSASQDVAPTLPARAESLSPTAPPAPDEPAADWMATTLQRPLFREDRRPAKSVDVGIPANGLARLVGIMTGPFGKRAIFVSPGEGKPVVVGEGARVTDFVVRAIGPGQAIVEADGSMRTLRPSANPPSVRN